MNDTIPQFNASAYELLLIAKIAKRAVALAKKCGVDYDYRDACMDLDACHSNGCPLDLQKLLDVPDADFGHDAFGIRRHINRRSGQLEDCFLPRCALPSTHQ